ncbi:hypothetical protein GOL75_27880 [Sinorhizobium medicae]|nr:hypothetical protein [Sinorhizobium medicae]MDX1165002.1 hypothetical protein [Sinorhizobium medicae]
MKPLVAACLGLSVSLTGCGGGIAPSADQRPVPLDAILNQMKCELALSFTRLDRNKLRFDGWFIDGQMTAKIITSDHVEGSLGTPQLVPLGSGGAGISFGFSASATRSRTLTQVIDFAVSPIAVSTDVCNHPRAPSVRNVEGLGIYEWLHTITQTAEGQPRMAVTHLSYTLDFGVKRVGSGGFDVVVEPIKLTSAANASRDDTQQLVLTFTPGEKAQQSMKRALSTSGAAQVITTPDGGTTVIFNVPPGAGQGILSNDVTMPEAKQIRELQ